MLVKVQIILVMQYLSYGYKSLFLFLTRICLLKLFDNFFLRAQTVNLQKMMKVAVSKSAFLKVKVKNWPATKTVMVLVNIKS